MSESISPQIYDGEGAELKPSIAFRSIFGFWLFFVFLATIRSLVFNPPGVEQKLMLLRLINGGGGLIFTIILYFVLRRFRSYGLSMRIAFAAGICIAPASGFAFIAASLYSNSAICSTTGKGTLAIPALPRNCNSQDWGETFAEVLITGYFLMAAWSALYLALSYAAEVRDWERRASLLRDSTQTAELRALRYQINPHFLFNTLNSLSALMISGQIKEAEKVIMGLSGYFRASIIDDPTQDVRLRDEIELQNIYLEIEKQRFPNRLKLDVQMDDDLEFARIPGMILQPLVENSIRHGVACSTERTTISIKASRHHPDKLELWVEDNARRLGPATPGTGIGLRNVAERLTARWGDEAVIRIYAGMPIGFAVRLTIPLTFDDR